MGTELPQEVHAGLAGRWAGRRDRRIRGVSLPPWPVRCEALRTDSNRSHVNERAGQTAGLSPPFSTTVTWILSGAQLAAAGRGLQHQRDDDADGDGMINASGHGASPYCQWQASQSHITEGSRSYRQLYSVEARRHSHERPVHMGPRSRKRRYEPTSSASSRAAPR